jgi:hypothetical protein
VRGLEKNAFASMAYSVMKVLLVTLSVTGALLLPYAAALSLRDERALPHLATLLLLHGSYGIIGRMIGIGWHIVPLLPFACLGIMFAYWRSTILTLHRRGVRWRETFYPLPLLREHLYE